MRFQVGHAQSIGRRKQQQDRFGHAQARASGLVTVVVADGMGGMAHGGIASNVAVEAFLARWEKMGADTPLPQALKECLNAANDRVFTVAEELEAAGEVGTTLVAAAFGPDGMHWISVGDSAIFHVQGSRIRQLNEFHNYGRELDLLAEQGVVPQTIVRNHPEREALTSFVGLEEIRLVDANDTPLALQPGDWVLLATDGLFHTLEPPALGQLAKGTAQKACEEMVKRTIEAGELYQDNVTVLAVKVEADRR